MFSVVNFAHHHFPIWLNGSGFLWVELGVHVLMFIINCELIIDLMTSSTRRHVVGFC